MRKAFPTLYKFTSKGQPQQWQIIVQDDHYFTQEGIVGGVITQSQPTYAKSKNVGKKSETSPEAQALLEAEARHKKKVAAHYNESLTDERNFFEPMLAHDVAKNGKVLFTKRTFVQPKLDGIRCVNQKMTLFTRNGKPILTCPHLYQDQYLLDGELYNHSLKEDFNELTSIIKRDKPNEDDIEKSKNIVEMWVYDLPTHDGVFSERYHALTQAVAVLDNPVFKVVPTTEVFTLEDIQNQHDYYINLGFEGTIVRVDLGPYENKRSKQLLKKKDWIDSEFEIVEVLEGEGNKQGMVGSITCKLPSGETFNSNMKGSWSYSKEIFDARETLVGKTATVKYQNLTPGGVPRFPYIIKINREEYE